MYMTPYNSTDARTPPTAPEQPLRPTSKASPFRINVLRSLKLHKVAAILTAIAILGLGTAVLLRRGVTYYSRSLVYISPVFQSTLTTDKEHEYPYESYVSEQVHAITQYDVLADALRHLKPGVWQQPGEPEQIAVGRLQKRLDVKHIGITYEVEIGLNGGSPEALPEVVNAVTQAYLAKARTEEFYGRDDRIKTLHDERDELQKALDAKLQEQSALTKDLGMAVVNNVSSSNPYDDELNKMRGDLTSAHEQRIQAEAQLSALKSGDSSSPNSALSAQADEIAASDPTLAALKNSLAQKRSQLVDQMAEMTPNNPMRKDAENQIAQIDSALQKKQTDLRHQAAMRLEQKYRAEVNRTSTIEAKLSSDLQQQSSAATSAGPKFQKSAELKADIDRLQARYNEIDTRINNLEIDSTSPGSIRLFAPAMVPLSPEPSKTKMLLPMLLPVALIAGILVAILIDFFDPRIYTGTDLEALLGFAPLGMLLDDGDVTQRAYEECMLRLAAGVDHATRLGKVRTFVFTGVHTGVGTTSIVENLGSTLAKLGRKTIAIDASGNTPPVAFVTMGMDSKPDAKPATPAPNAPVAATNEHATTAVEVHKQTQALSEAPAAPLAPLSGYVSKALQGLTNDYEIVLIDAAPLLISAETEYLARSADVTVLVVEAGRSVKSKVTRAARLLEKLNIAGAASVINKVRLDRVEDTLRHEILEFESRSNNLNLRWRPHFGTPATPGAFQGAPAAQEKIASFVND